MRKTNKSISKPDEEVVVEKEQVRDIRSRSKQHSSNMFSMLKGSSLKYSEVVDNSYELLLCSIKDKTGIEPLLEFSKSSIYNSNDRMISRVIKNVKDLLMNSDTPLDYLEPDEIESTYSAISKDTNQIEVKIL